MSERDNLILAVSDDNDWTFLELQAEEMALTKEQVVAMLIRKARKAYEKPEPQFYRNVAVTEISQEEMDRTFAEQAKREAEEQRQRELAEKRARLQAELAALDGEPTPLEEWTEIDRAIHAEVTGLPEFDESLLRQPEPDPIRSAIIPSSAAPGSLTGPVGIRRDLKGGDVMGDARANIIRRNFKHLGAG